jgi:tetratricopeptide (TPR) repeat protein
MKLTKSTVPNPTIYVAYLITLVVFEIAAFVPGSRVWGIGSWAYFPIWIRFSLLVIGVAAPWAIERVFARNLQGDNDIFPRTYSIIAAAVAVGIVVLFYVLRGGTHFLGDGYTLIANLASAHPNVKYRELGEELVHGWVYAITSGGDSGSLLAYQVISIASGIIFLAILISFVRFYFEKNIDRVLALLGLVSGGYVLMFFGYVENYSLLCVSIGIFTMTGMLIFSGRISRWWIVPALALVVLIHMIGAVFVPAALYTLLVGTPIGTRIGQLSFSAKAMLVVGLLLAALSALFIAFRQDYFLRFAFLSITHGRFTSEGYTMFSAKHVVDFVNLLFILAPGLLVFAAVLITGRTRRFFAEAWARFLIIAILSTLGATFALDPRLGMPRDWDLFSIPGVPIILFVYALSARLSEKHSNYRQAAAMCIVLGFLSLMPRVVVQQIPEKGVAYAENAMTLDHLKNRPQFIVLAKYFQQQRDSVDLARINSFRAENFPQESMILQAKELLSKNRGAEAMELAHWVTDNDPQWYEGWIGLSRCYLAAGKHDSSLWAIKIANGLNPYSPTILYDFGNAYAGLGDWPNAEQAWLGSAELDPNEYPTFWKLARLYEEVGKPEKYAEYIKRAASFTDAPRALLKEAAENSISRNRFDEAASFLSRGLQKGLDSAYVRGLAQRYPRLKSVF